MAKRVHRIKGKTHRGGRAIRKYADERIDKFEEIKFEMGCSKCNKVIKGKVKSRGYTDKKKDGTYFGTKLYCEKCFKKLFHPVIKNER